MGAVIVFCHTPSYASPWIEANDSFLRSSMLALSDGGLLSGPTSTFPLRWSLVTEQAGKSDAGKLKNELAYFNYSLQSAKLNRGNRRFAVKGGGEESQNNWFSDVSRDEWAVEASYEHLSNSFAFRWNGRYQDRNNDQEFSFKESYLAFNAGKALVDISSLPKWWGHGWNHNLILSTSGEDLDVGLSWMGDTRVIGVWNVNINITQLDDLDYDYRTSFRYVSQLSSWLEFGLSNHYWFEANKSRAESSQSQAAVDARASLPQYLDIQHSVYTELASAQKQAGLGAYMIGWSGHRPIGGSSLRIAIEYQSIDADERYKIRESTLDNYLQSSYLLNKSWTISGYFQLKNDHKISIVVATQESLDAERKKQNKYQLSYQLPMLKGQVKLMADVTDDNNESETYLWSQYEFRF
ncbi:hypothetical protein HLM86_016090 [Vibrio ostreicida]|nr:hypothetical protein [Vibrio ostreicida]